MVHTATISVTFTSFLSSLFPFMHFFFLSLFQLLQFTIDGNLSLFALFSFRSFQFIYLFESLLQLLLINHSFCFVFVISSLMLFYLNYIALFEMFLTGIFQKKMALTKGKHENLESAWTIDIIFVITFWPPLDNCACAMYVNTLLFRYLIMLFMKFINLTTSIL